MTRRQGLVRAYVALVSLAALALGCAFASTAAGSVLPHWRDLLVLAPLYFLCASMLMLTPSSRAVGVSLGFVIGMAAVLLTTPLESGLVSAVAGIQYWRGGIPLLKRCFNASQFCMAGMLSGLLFSWVSPSETLNSGEVARLTLATVLVVCSYYLVNNMLLAGVVSLAEGISPAGVFWGALSWSTVSYLAYGLLGLAMAVLWQISIVAGLLVLVPIFVARWAFAQYAAEQAAYDSTVAALCQAVETKDLYTRGHSERVALGSVLIARQLGMREDRVGAIRYAGMLHDVGKLGVPTRVLQKSGQLTQEEFDAIKLHPVRGHEMLRGIDFLSEALAGIIHHHERLDGRGYPMGLKGADIPEFARIIAVADSLDAMTSTRSYRAAKSVEEALGEIRAGSGTQFDPVMVSAVEAAVARHGWSAQRRKDDGEKPVGVASMGEVLLADDHDERLLEGGRPA